MAALVAASETSDPGRQILAVDKVRHVGKALPDDSLEPSELILPPADASMDEVRDMLGDSGLIPG